MSAVGIAEIEKINERVRICDYLTVAQLFLQNNFLLERPLEFDDIKPRLLGHWGTCHGINVAYANLSAHFKDDSDFHFVLGPGHGFPALQANLFIDGELERIDPEATLDENGIEYICKNFSWPDEFKKRGITVYGNIAQEEGEKVLENYVKTGKEVYKPSRFSL